MKKTLLAALALLALAPCALAQDAAPTEQIGRPVVTLYDLDSTTPIYCSMTGVRIGGPPFSTPYKIKTVGSSTSVTAATAGQAPFNGVSVGDEIVVNLSIGQVTPAPGVNAARTYRVVTAKADADNITVNAAIDLSGPVGTAGTAGYRFEYLRRACGTAATDGWYPVAGGTPTFSWAVNQFSVTSGGVDFRIECKHDGADAQPIQAFPATGFTTYTAAGIASRASTSITIPYSYCRLGMQLNGVDEGVDTGANAEQITAWFTFVK